jgi:hypothetical protein
MAYRDAPFIPQTNRKGIQRKAAENGAHYFDAEARAIHRIDRNHAKDIFDDTGVSKKLEIDLNEMVWVYTNPMGYEVWAERGQEVPATDKPIVFSRWNGLNRHQAVALVGVATSAFHQQQPTTQIVSVLGKGTTTILNTCLEDVNFFDEIMVDPTKTVTWKGDMYPQLYVTRDLKNSGNQLVQNCWKKCLKQARLHDPSADDKKHPWTSRAKDEKNMKKLLASDPTPAVFRQRLGERLREKYMTHISVAANALLFTAESVEDHCRLLARMWRVAQDAIIEAFEKKVAAGGPTKATRKKWLDSFLDILESEVGELKLNIGMKLDTDKKRFRVGHAMSNANYLNGLNIYFGER